MSSELENQAEHLWNAYIPETVEEPNEQFWRKYENIIELAQEEAAQVIAQPIVEVSTEVQTQADYPSVANAYKKLSKTEFEFYGNVSSESKGNFVMSFIAGFFLSGFVMIVVTLIYQEYYWQWHLGILLGFTLYTMFTSGDNSNGVFEDTRQTLELQPDYFLLNKATKIYYGNVTDVKFDKFHFTIYEYFTQHGKDKDRLPLFNKNGNLVSRAEVQLLKDFFTTVVEERKIGGLIKK